MSEATNNSELTVGAIRHQFIRGMYGANDESLVIQGAIFDRWLASVKADAWDEFAVAARACDVISRSQKETLWEMNPYRGEER
jgi:hypothetical protein